MAIIGALLDLFRRKNKDKGYASPWLVLTVVYATSLDGLEPDTAFVMRGKVIAAGTIRFEFISPASFIAFYPGTTEGMAAGQALAASLEAVALERAVAKFGVSVQQGECLAQLAANGRLVAKPAGVVIAQTVDEALRKARG